MCEKHVLGTDSIIKSGQKDTEASIMLTAKLFSNVTGADMFKPWCGRPIDI